MKRQACLLLVILLALTLLLPCPTYAEGDGNIDHGGGGINPGNSRNKWNGGDEGVRVTVVRASDRAVVSTPIDFSNRNPNPKIAVHFGKVSKLSYTAGQPLTPSTTAFTCEKPDIAIPRIISVSGRANITEIKKYFCSEYMAKMVADLTGMDYDILIGGKYKLLLEPFAYVTYEGIRIAMTATEAGLYDQVLGGGLRNRIPSTSHKNLPLSMFLETSDLGYPAWSGSRTSTVSNADIISSLGLGIVSFKEVPQEPELTTYDYEYRVNTEVITAVTVNGGQADPDHPVTVRFNILGQTYTVSGVYYPDGDSQLVWVRWTTPVTPQIVRIDVSASGPGSVSKSTLTAKIVDLSGNDPPNPVADDRNDAYPRPTVPSKAQKASASWGVWSPWWFEYWVWHSDWNWYSDGEGGGHWEDDGEWVDEGWWKFDWNAYSASLSASMSIMPDAKAPTASGKAMKSGYGINQVTSAQVSTNQSSAVTHAQTAVTYFPEFQYESFWRLLERTGGGYSARFEFAPNQYSTYNRRTHFTPIWMPDGSYTPYTWLIDCWTPAGMLSMNLTDSVTIHGSLWDDWHIAPVRP